MLINRWQQINATLCPFICLYKKDYQMKTIYLILFFLILLSGCKKENENSGNPGDLIDLSKPVDSAILKKYHYDTISFKPIDLSAINLEVGSIYIDVSVSSGIWALTIEMYDSLNALKRISFAVQDLHNSQDSLIKKGVHSATGQGSGLLYPGLLCACKNIF
jgi:hypothetical protein